MQSREMAPALEIMNAIDVTKFVASVIYSEQAIKTTIQHLKHDNYIRNFFGWD